MAELPLENLTIPTSSSTAEDVVNTFAAEVKGKNVLVTGTSLGGLGFETSRAIARYANMVIITGHNDERLKLSETAIKKDNPTAKIHPLLIDLTSLASVRKAAEEVNKLAEPIHVLINNAAVGLIPFKLTSDGLELHWSTNHVGPFLFTNLIMPKILASASPTYTPRVVFVSSVAHANPGDPVNLDALTNPDPTKYSPPVAYRDTKAANILTALELFKRAKGKVNTYSLHPGLIYTNAFEKDGTLPIFQGAGVLDENGKPILSKSIPWKSIGQGAATTVTAAFDPSLNDKPGAYLEDCQIANDKVAPHASDPETARKLWDVTEKLVGESFAF
ncbi:short-chain dehydrogenase/reductase family protein [Favolaschia claudopus]|uniref:Short-chain dehydrogenase/reductase family protein n=1 Tax=Favolaschia claudopus TaxID=2862362 RepID=A0AAW0AGB5_9AGAR